MGDDWQHPDHYVVLDCPECPSSLATARRALEANSVEWCYDCGYTFSEDDVIEYGPYWDEEA